MLVLTIADLTLRTSTLYAGHCRLRVLVNIYVYRCLCIIMYMVENSVFSHLLVAGYGVREPRAIAM